ncbi:ent-kaurene oxidase [Aspergillus udagawae]|uniref:Ent-kaurene oxidase n=1 Tax=Aspergillus udagawae TaxID=91492 RepID=A0A8E0QM67_9EURO|nr:uncharacterized protein Aud_001398 [Aspergillus udagawae]GFF33517.1 ent-kaurene oxidase [Aspergillus udagawae]GFF79699.1 ent-kaurene oxidase [Aspergillus udagawae]GFG22052.1 ent-kaurene oxidase [Aspergillus udagawae]GIC85566.1 hypothetical protein Aud_001398 [Aspergillus udagawae]
MLEILVVFLILCLRRIRGLWYLARGPDIIDKAYLSAEGMPFKISTPSNDHWLVTSNDLITELANAPLQNLSLHAVAKEILQPKYTMFGFEWQDQRGVEGTGFVRALRSRLTAHLPILMPELQRIVETAIADELAVPGKDGFVHCRLFSMIKRTVTKVNCFAFFGEDLGTITSLARQSHQANYVAAQNPEFTAAALEFPQRVILAAEILRITPGFLRRSVANLVTRQHYAVRTLFRYLEPIVEKRLATRAKSTSAIQEDAPMDCMQWLIDTSPRKIQWTTTRMVGEIIAVWFGSVHQLAMTTTYAIEDLCLHNDYVEPLRAEIQQYLAGSCRRRVAEMPLLDSFVRESIRCTNSDAITVRRKALTPFVFSDGLEVAEGDWVCIPQRAMMRDRIRYQNPQAFDGFRFARANKQLRAGDVSLDVPESSPLMMTDVSVDWPIWGLGNTACPGRFYAATILKLIMVCILEGWECRLEDPGSQRWRTWRSSIVPREGTVVLFKRKEEALTG